MPSEPTATPPIGCDLTAIPADARDAHLALAQRVFTELRQETRELPDSLAFRFAADAYDDVAAFVANERRCCPFIAFALHVPPQHADLWLELTGTADVKGFLLAEFTSDATS